MKKEVNKCVKGRGKGSFKYAQIWHMQYIQFLGISDALSSKHGCGHATPALWGSAEPWWSVVESIRAAVSAVRPVTHRENDVETWVRARSNDNVTYSWNHSRVVSGWNSTSN